MTEPRNVTPEQSEEFRARHQQERAEEPEWMAWKWASRGRGFPWLGVLLVLIGIGLLVQYLVPDVRVSTLVLLAVGGAFLASWLFGGSRFSMVPGVLFVSISLAMLVEDLGIIFGPGVPVPGAVSLGLAAGFLVIWLIGQRWQRRWTWPLWGAAVFGLIGFVQASGRLLGVPQLGALWPLLIIGLGVLVVLSARRR
ncbi:hypothetical protein BH24CHL6_BH24CHL6_11980 [soil metagenome]